MPQSNTDKALPLALTMGTPGGIGPEVAVKAWQHLQDVPDAPPLLWIGQPDVAEALTDIELVSSPLDACHCDRGRLPVLDVGEAAPAKATIAAIEKATAFALDHQVSGVVTAPISKADLYDVGFSHPGHTEFLASLCGDCDVAMMLAIDGLRVVPVTIHIPLAQVASQLTTEAILSAIKLTARDLAEKFAITAPRIAVAALNPHGGESGRIGTEETSIIVPACDAARRDGLQVTGPLPADTLFHAAARQQYDAVICMYHDQALIPLKALDFDSGVNVTLGLPIIRTSPDHGTAFDIAGQNIANPSSMIAAIKIAAQMAQQS